MHYDSKCWLFSLSPNPLFGGILKTHKTPSTNPEESTLCNLEITEGRNFFKIPALYEACLYISVYVYNPLNWGLPWKQRIDCLYGKPSLLSCQSSYLSLIKNFVSQKKISPIKSQLYTMFLPSLKSTFFLVKTVHSLQF